ncbi:MAG: alpha/beta hydrolase family protein [Gaiellaceae bacterium]
MSARLVHRYGDHPSQVGELFLPAGTPVGVTVVLHGGFWRAAYDRHLMDDLCADLAAAGWVAWNLEYRRTAGADGGWPATLLDVAAGIDHLATLDIPEGQALGHGRIGQDRVEHSAGQPAESHGATERDMSGGLSLTPLVAIGHSAGGHLALWAAARGRLPAGAPGAAPRVQITHAVSQAGVVDLLEAARLGLGRGAAQGLVGAQPDSDSERWRLASPAALLPLGVPQLLVHGAHDDIVPAALSEAYARRAVELGDDARAVILPGMGHFAHLDPSSAAWQAVRDWLNLP